MYYDYNVCHNCTTAIENGDYSGTDDADQAAIVSFAEMIGIDYTISGPVERGGYWECDSCSHIMISNDGYIFNAPDAPR